ncbi:MAG: hypothetical protein K2H18_04335, partial [Muribaculaceae bacterium]|nr:hypothetical protein [Muribaculaceae bacterium]
LSLVYPFEIKFIKSLNPLNLKLRMTNFRIVPYTKEIPCIIYIDTQITIDEIGPDEYELRATGHYQSKT